MRHIVKLRYAAQLPGWPELIPHSRPRGIKALGPRYEAAVARQLGSEAKRGIWWEYRDANGPGLCQTDFIILGQKWCVILECKHTWIDEGFDQLKFLYMPVVEMATNRRVIGVQVCKHLTPHHVGPVYDSLEAAVMGCKCSNRGLVTLHWRGVGPMLSHSKTLAKEFAYE